MSDHLSYDVVIVGAGPAGLAAAIRLKQMAQDARKEISVCVLEKGAEVGAHILSGAVLEPRALEELFPHWASLGAPLKTPVSGDAFWYLTEKKHRSLPVPPQMKNHGNYIISLGDFVRWLGGQAESLGVDILPGFSVASYEKDDSGAVVGVTTQAQGRDKQGNPTSSHEEGVFIGAQHTVFAEGCRGSLSQGLMQDFDLRQGRDPQTYGLGIKELWKVRDQESRVGQVLHTVGWPLDSKTYGGSFLYHLDEKHLAIGYVVGLDYENPYLDPYAEFQRFKHHPSIQPFLDGGQRLSYGARALNEGGYQSRPHLSFPGGSLVGCAAGFLNVPKIKGTHTAMKSGMLAAQAIFETLVEKRNRPTRYFDQLIKESWVEKELWKVRNIRPGFSWGLLPGLLNAALETLLQGYSPWTLSIHADHTKLKTKDKCQPMDYPKPDGKISFDRMSSVYLSGVTHRENQPCHLVLKNENIPQDVNLPHYDGPEQRYCPAGVYEYVTDSKTQKKRLQINAQNCIHCKTCDIKDPLQNILWTTPEGGGGPLYPNM